MSKNIFNSVKFLKPQRSKFDLTHDIKMSTKMGFLSPTTLIECLPGDKFNIGCDTLVRMAPLISPMMHRVDVTVHYFFVPYRLLWDNWENYITNTEVDGLLPAFPTVVIDGSTYSRLHDYLGIPTPLPGQNEVVNAMPMAAYQFIYNEYYRSQQLTDEINYKLEDGDNSGNGDLSQWRRRCWEHDYFTSALPTPQAGAPVDIPLGTVELDPTTEGNTDAKFRNYDDYTSIPTDAGLALVGGDLVGTAPPDGPYVYDPAGTLKIAPTTLNDLRTANKLQEWLERAARGGSRLVEMIKSQFGVNSSDSRMQRPEYITGVKNPIIISEVLNNTGIDGELPQGNMAGHGVGINQGQYGDYYCEEHGFIMGIMSVMPKTAYQQGLPKIFMKTQSPFDFAFPTLANLGEQEIKKKELYAFQGASGNDLFGYIPRYAEYKFQNNMVAGDFRTTLNYWTMARIFSTPPELNDVFVMADPTKRVFAVDADNVDELYCQVLNKVYSSRLLPFYGIPQF